MGNETYEFSGHLYLENGLWSPSLVGSRWHSPPSPGLEGAASKNVEMWGRKMGKRVFIFWKMDF